MKGIDMKQRVSNWISVHTTPMVAVASLVVLGVVLILASVCILLSYPNANDKNPIAFVLVLGFVLLGYGAQRWRRNALLADLDKIINE